MSRATTSAPPQIWLDGAFIPASDPRLPSWHYGAGMADGVYETFRGYAGVTATQLLRPERLRGHLDRLARGCDLLGLARPFPEERLLEALAATLKRNNLEGRDARLRIVLWRGDPGAPPDPAHLAVYALPLDQGLLEERRARGLRVITLPPSRVAGDPLPQVKHLGGLAARLARMRCEAEGVDDALFLNSQGEVCEAVWSNVFLLTLDGSSLCTPPARVPCLPGTTQRHLFSIATSLGLEIREVAFPPAALHEAREVFATSSVSEVMPVVEINGRPIGGGRPGPIAAQLQRLYRERILKELNGR